MSSCLYHCGEAAIASRKKGTPMASVSKLSDGHESTKPFQHRTTSPAVTEAVFAPVAPPTTVEAAVARLGAAVRLGILPPGSRLPPERELAERLEISRTTLRHVLTALIQGGLLVTKRGRTGGTWVAEAPPPPPTHELSQEDWNRCLDSRIALEAGAALLAAQRASKEQLDELQSIHDELSRVVEAGLVFAEFRRLDIRFHMVLTEASGSVEFMSAMPEVQNQMTMVTASYEWPKLLLKNSNDQHQKIINALRAGNGGSAAEAAFQHVNGTRLVVAGFGDYGSAPQ